MEDREIVELFWHRQERAIAESAAKYGGYLHKVAGNILESPEDAEECVSDTWLRAWNAIPPEKPANLKMFLAKIARNRALDQYRRSAAQKRGGREVEAILDELSALAPDTESQVELRELTESVNRFIRALPQREGDILIRRYFFAEHVFDIAARYGMTVNAVSASLSRSRKKLAAYLKKEGFYE